MEDTDMRNELLQELIGKMHDRLADKEYPSEDKPPVEEAVAEVVEEPKVEETDEEMSDEDIAELAKMSGE